AGAEATDPEEREHVTPFVYRRPERYRLAAFLSGGLWAEERWTLDTLEDLERLRDIVSKLDDPVGAGWRDVLAVAGESHRRPPGSILLRPDVDPAGADPGNRTWLVVRGSEPVGSVQVTVRAGVGSVRAE